MLLINLPAPQNPPIPDFTVGVDLDGASYTLRFVWNTTDEYWYSRTLDDPGVTLLMGETRIVADQPLYLSRRVRTPGGFLIARDTTGQGIAPKLNDFGSRVQLWYLTEEELADLGLDL
jgi:hypothetical protein